MGKVKRIKKLRKYARKEADRISGEFADKFRIDDYVRPRPKLIPKFIWNLIIMLILKK